MNLFKKVCQWLVAILLSLSLGLSLAGCGSSTAASGSQSTKNESASQSALTVRMLDIGQGDSFLLEKDGKFVMIDTGDVEHRDAIV